MPHDKTIDRRHLLVLGAVAPFGLAACRGDDKKSGTEASGEAAQSTKGGTGCETPLDAKSKQMRKTLQYKEKAADASKACEKCAQYEKGKFGDCGGCKLFAGPVQPAGGCLSFAPIGGGDAAPSATATG